MPLKYSTGHLVVILLDVGLRHLIIPKSPLHDTQVPIKNLSESRIQEIGMMFLVFLLLT